jgi:FtsH-binding integral membrane protein
MMGGLLTTALVAVVVLATLPVRVPFYSSWGPLVLILAEFALVWCLTSRLRANAIASGEEKALLLVYAASLGAVLVPALAAAAGAVLPALLAGSGMFGAAGVWGYVTHSDMRPLGTALFMGVVGLFIALIGNGLLAHAALSFRISAAGVLLFSGLTAYDIRRIGASAHRRIGASAHRRIGASACTACTAAAGLRSSGRWPCTSISSICSS